MNKYLFTGLPIFVFAMILLANIIALLADTCSPLYILLMLPTGVLCWSWASWLCKKHGQEIDMRNKN